MVRLTPISSDVSTSGEDQTSVPGALSLITVQAGRAKIVLALLKHHDSFQVRIHLLTPDLTDVGTSLDEAKALRQDHQELTAKLHAKQKEVAAVLTKAPGDVVVDGGAPGVAIHPLADAWNEVNKQMEYRKMLLDQSVAFHSSAIQFGRKMDEMEEACCSSVQAHDVDSARQMIQQHQDLKKHVLEASMATLQEGQTLLERIRKAALLCTYSTARHATTSACYAIERLLQLLRDKWRKLDELWMRRLLQLQQCLQLGLADQEATRVRAWLDSVGDAYISKKDLGDSLDSAYSLQEECLNIEAQLQEFPGTVNRLLGTVEYLLSSLLPTEGDCGSVKQRLVTLQRRIEDLSRLFTVRRNNVTLAAQFFSLAQVAIVKLGEIESQLQRGHTTAERYSYLASVVVDTSTPAVHSGQSLMAKIGGSSTPAAQGVQSALSTLEAKRNRLQLMCNARFDVNKYSEQVIQLFNDIDKLSSWYTHVGEAIVKQCTDVGVNLTTAQDYIETHQTLITHLKAKIAEVNAVNVKVEALVRSGVEKDAESGKELGAKIKSLLEQFNKLSITVENRIKIAANNVGFQKRVKQFSTDMDSLELHLKLDKMDPSLVPDSSVKHKNELYQKMIADWTEVESKGKQLIKDATDQAGADEELKMCVEFTKTAVEALLLHLNDRKSILAEYFERWKAYTDTGREFRTQWQQFVNDARQTIDWIMKVEDGFFPKLAGELGSSLSEVKQQQKKLEDFKPTIVKAQDDTEKLLKIAELLSLKGNTRGHRDELVNEILKVHTRFTARVGEYRFLLNMAEKFFNNLSQLDELIKSTEAVYASEEMPKEVSAAQTALRQHNDSRNKLQQLINFASDEADQIVIRVRQQDSESLAKDEVQKVLQLTEEKRRAWEKAWEDQRKRLEQNFQVCQFRFDLKQLQDELDELQRLLDMRQGNYGNSLSSVQMIAEAFNAFVKAADSVEGRVKEFMTTADRLMKDPQLDSRRIRHEVDETERRWKTFYNSIKNYGAALADSAKFFENWQACEHWISDAAVFLQGISREAPHCATIDDVDRLIKKIENYRMDGYKEQDARLNAMDRIVTDLYGSVAGPEKLQPLLDKNQEMFNAFVKAVEELAVLRNNLNKTEQILAQVGAVVEQKAPRQPRFVQPLHNAELMDGHPFTFECRLECDTTTPLIEWFKDGAAMTHGTTEYKDGLCRLTLDIVGPNDSATYTCKATTAAGCAETTATVKVKETQQKVITPQISKQLKSSDAPEGTSLLLECYLSGIPYPTVSWFKDGVCIDSDPEYVITQGNNSGEPCTLKIRRLDKTKHSGVYSIKATNPGGEATSSATVNVIAIKTPEFTQPLKDERVQEGKTIHLECKFTGEPPPQIQWMCNDVQILPSAMFQITVNPGVTSLDIREVFSEDCGTYTVIAKNMGGEARTSCHLSLVEAPAVDTAAVRAGARRPVKPLFVQPLESRSVLEGNHTRLECVITGYPEPAITWLHNDKPVKRSKDIEMVTDCGRCSLIIHEVYLEDAGQYVCAGTNEHGTAQTSCQLSVEPLGDLSDTSISATGDVPPKFTQLLKDIEGTEGELVRFECRVIGQPTPTIKWYCGRNQVENSPDFQILTEKELQALTIPTVHKDDAGNYMVKANNDAGQAKCYATLIVKPASDRHAMKMRLIESCHAVQTNIVEGGAAPEISRAFRDLHVRPGDPCTMEVVVTGKPPPKVQWLFNNEMVSKDYQLQTFGDVHTLHIPAVMDKDAGRFSVIAENSSGKAWCSALLVVVEASQLLPDEGSPPETPQGPYIQPVIGPVPLHSKVPRPTAAAPQFTQKLENLTMDEGSTTTLECQVSGHPEPAVRWYKEGRPLSASQKVEIRKQDGRVRLIIYGVKEHDSGRYTCIAQNHLGENSSSANVIVNVVGVAPQFTEKLHSQRIREGGSARFVARVSGNPPPEVAWYREGVKITSSPDFVISTSPDGVHSLSVGEVFREDAGKFTARATNPLGQVQCVADLIVEPKEQVKPQFTKPLKNQRAEVGQRITLECAIPPHPEPDQVRWYRNEVFLELSPDYQPAYRDGICSLTIPRIGPQHAGKYSCVVVIRGVPNSSDMHLEVYAPQEPGQLPQFVEPMKNVHAGSGQDAVFICHVSANPPPTVHWYHNDQLLRPSRRHEIKHTRDGVCSLRIRDISPEDAGRYTCTATNVVGQSSSQAHLNVEPAEQPVDESSYVSPETLRRLMISPGRFREGDLGGVAEQFFKPVFRKVPADLEVPEGHLARFDCVVSGRPIPDMLWFRDGSQVFPDFLHKIVINEEGISSLIIDSTRLSDSGLYTCIARNRAGEDRFQVRLNILPGQTSTPPRFTSRMNNQTVSDGQSVTFEAEITGVPVPALSWQKDGRQIYPGADHYQIHTEANRSTLYIPSVRADDEAWYQCTAASVSGTATNRVRLQVVRDARRTPVEPTLISTKQFVAHAAPVSGSLLSPGGLAPSPARPISPRASPRPLESHVIVARQQQQQQQQQQTTVQRVEASGVAAPRLIEPMRDQHLNDGAMAHFWCKIYSASPTTCEWFHNDRTLSSSDKYRIANNPHDGDYALMVFNVRPHDAGVYKCVVSNPGGEVTCIAHLHVESLHAPAAMRVEHTSHGPAAELDRPTTMSAQQTTTVTSSRVVEQQITSTQQHHQHQAAPVQSHAPAFTRQLENASVRDGSEVTLSCVVSGHPTPTVSWYHNDRNVDASADFSISYDQATGRCRLAIVDCMTRDQGRFKCVARNAAGSAETQCMLSVLPGQDSTDMTSSQISTVPTSGDEVDAGGQAPKFVEPMQPCVVVEGDSCTFRAVVRGDPQPQVDWLKEKVELLMTDRHSVAYDVRSGVCSLVMRNCQQSDTGVYSCRAGNICGRATCTANVVVVPPNVEVTVTEKTTSVKKEKVTTVGDQEIRVVESSPTFTETLPPVTEVNEGEQVRLHCRYHGEPEPKVMWLLNGSQLYASDHVTLSGNADQSLLTIHGVTLADTGEYACTASNTLGQSTTKTFLRVRRLEQASVEPVPQYSASEFTATQQLQPSFPPTFASQPLASGVEVVLPLEPPITVDPLSSQQQIPPAHRPPPSVGGVESQPPVDESPRFTLGLENQTVTCGDAAVFTVFFKGHPRPHVHWYIDGKLVYSSSRESGRDSAAEREVVVGSFDGVEVVEDLDRCTSTLTVLSSAVANEAQYTCRVNNRCGTAFTNAHLFVLARSPAVSQDINQLTRVKSSPRSDTELFSHKIESERPVAVIRTDSSSQVTCTHPQPLFSNMFVPISVAEQFNYSEDELSTFYEHHQLLMQTTSEQQPVPTFSETVSIDASDNQEVAVELLKLKKSTLDVQQKALPQGCRVIAEIAGGPQTFSETLSIDTCDHHAVGVDLLKLKKSTLDVQQKALPCGYRMIADVSGPQTFSETVSVDSEDRRMVGVELIKRKTSAMDVQRKALPKGLRLEAEILPRAETTKLYVARTKCIEGIVEKPIEQPEEGSPPVFVVQLQTLETMDGGKARLVCRVRGRPMPESTEWRRKGKIIPEDTPEFVATYDAVSGDASFSIPEVLPVDAGVYECSAENRYGRASTKAELIVEPYEYIPDSEEFFSESTMSSTYEAIQQTLVEPAPEEIGTVCEENIVLMADVQWCHRSLLQSHQSEVASEFRLDRTDGQKLIEHEIADEGLVKPKISGRAQTRVQQQIQRTVEERTVDQLKFSSAEDRATQKVTEKLENQAEKQFLASWAFTQMSKLDEEALGVVVSERVPSPQNTTQREVLYELERSTARFQPSHTRVTTEYQSEGEEDDLYLDVPEPSVLPKPTDAYELNRVCVNRRRWMLTLLQRVFYESEATQPQQVDYKVESSTPQEVPKLFGLASKALPTPTLAVLQYAVYALQTVGEWEKAPASEVTELSPTMAAVLEQAARVEAARLSLVKPLVETNKIDATKDLHDDELDDLLERSRSLTVRIEYLEPFREPFPLSHTVVSEDRVSPSRSVGSVSPTNDLSLIPSTVETALDEADTSTVDVLFEEDILPDELPKVTRPPFPTSDSVVVEDNLPEAVCGMEDVEMLLSEPALIQVALDKADIILVDVMFEEEVVVEDNLPEVVCGMEDVEMLLSESALIQVALDKADIILVDVIFKEEVVVEDNLPEVVCGMEDVEMLLSEPALIQVALDKVDIILVDVMFEEEIMPAKPSVVTRAPVPIYDSSDLVVAEDYLSEAVSAMDDVEVLAVCPTDIKLQLYNATVTEVELRECDYEMISIESASIVGRPREPSTFWSEERSCSPFIVDECTVVEESIEVATLTPQDVDGVVLEKATVVEDDVYFIEEENFFVEATVDLQQLMKMVEREMIHTEERCVSPFPDENMFLKLIPRSLDLLTLAPQDHVTESMVCAQIHEADVYYYEEESMVVDVVCDLTQMTQITQRDLITSEERPISPVQNEAVFMRPLSTDVERISIDSVDHVEAPLNRAKADECDVYYYEEESFSVDVVCDLKRTLLRSSSPFAVEERVSPDAIQLEASLPETSAQPLEIRPTDAYIAAKKRSSETFVLPQIIVHRVEAASRLSPLPVGTTAITSEDSTPLSKATIDECTIFTQDEEAFSESTLQQTTTFDQRIETFSDEKPEAEEEEIFEEESTVQHTTFFEQRLEGQEKISEADDELEMYSSGEEMFEEKSTVQQTTFFEQRLEEQEKGIFAEVVVDQNRRASDADDEFEMYSSGEEIFEEKSTIQQTTFFERRLEGQDKKVSAEVAVDQKNRLESEARKSLKVPGDDFDLYSSGEETFDSWIVETYKIYEETRNVEADMTFRRNKQPAQPIVVESAAPVFSRRLTNMRVMEGQRAKLECHVIGCPQTQLKWFVDGAELSSSDEFTITRRNPVCCLVINEVLAEDEGEYMVMASNEKGTVSTSAYLTVVKQDDRSDEKEMYSSGEETSTGVTDHHQQSVDVVEEFNKLEIDVSLQRKEATCADVNRQVEAPSFTKKLEPVDVFEGTPVRLECDVTGFPQPQITWYQNGKQLDTSEHMQLDYMDGRCTMTIDRVRIDDEAEYVCTATNERGSVSTWAELLVEKLIKGLEQLVMEEHYEVEIEMNFKWKTNQQRLADQSASKDVATIN